MDRFNIYVFINVITIEIFQLYRESERIAGPANQSVFSKLFLGPNEHLMDILELAYDDSRLPDEVNRYFNVIWFYAIWLVEIIVKENDSGHVKWAKKKISVQIRFFLELCLLDLPDLILLLQSRDTLIGQIRRGIPKYHQSFQISLYSHFNRSIASINKDKFKLIDQS